jgi:hypothetical protein
MSIEERFILAFGTPKVSKVYQIDDQVDIIALDFSDTKRVIILTTCGLSSHKMKVPDHLSSQNSCEIYFCVPSYWEVLNEHHPKSNWIIKWLELIVKYIKSSENWIGAGHTLKCGVDKLPLSPTMKHEYFVFSNPVLMLEEFTKLKSFNENINFFALIPVFRKEFEYKQRKGIDKFTLKMNAAGMTEKLDEFRPSLIRITRLFF